MNDNNEVNLVEDWTPAGVKKRVSFMLEAFLNSLRSQGIVRKYVVTIIGRGNKNCDQIMSTAGLEVSDTGYTVYDGKVLQDVSIQYLTFPLIKTGFTDARGQTRLLVLVESSVYNEVMSDELSRVVQSLYFSLTWSAHETHQVTTQLLVPVITQEQ